jgi:STE24 endopeptidase
LDNSEVRIYESELEAARAKRYSRIRLATLAGSTAWTLAGLSLIAFTGASKRLKRKLELALPDERLVRPAFVASAIAASWSWNLPVAHFAGYRIEREYELTQQTPRGWLRDEVVSLGVGSVLSVPALTLANEVMRRRPRDWWIILSAATIPVSVVLSNLAPILIMPLFNKFERLEGLDLAVRIEELARKSGVPIAGVYRMDMSRQSEKANAFFTGVGNTKRIVLADTLLDKFPEAETMGVVAHELAHQVHRDIWTLIAMGTGSTLFIAWGTGKLAPKVIRQTSKLTGVNDLADIAALPILGLTAAAFASIVAPINAAISRIIERRADRFALEQTRDGRIYAATMARLGRQNLADPTPSRLVTALMYSHPPLAERIKRALAFQLEIDAETP